MGNWYRSTSINNPMVRQKCVCSGNIINKITRTKMRYKMLSLRVVSLTCWLRKIKPARSINVPAIGQLVVEHDQLKSPSNMRLGKGEGKYII